MTWSVLKDFFSDKEVERKVVICANLQIIFILCNYSFFIECTHVYNIQYLVSLVRRNFHTYQYGTSFKTYNLCVCHVVVFRAFIHYKISEANFLKINELFLSVHCWSLKISRVLISNYNSYTDWTEDMKINFTMNLKVSAKIYFNFQL